MLEEYKHELEQVLLDIKSYEISPTKKMSAMIRKRSLRIGKMGPELRTHMISLDKAK